MKNVKEKEKIAYNEMKAKYGYKSQIGAPHVEKVVLSSATGTGMKKDQKRNEHVVGRIAKITGQKPSLKGAKKSVASFKIRQGDPIGVTVTLRGARMYSFLDKLFDISLPRTKDFRGLERKIVDSMGNITIGIKEHTIFPETADEDIRDVFGLAITITTTAKTKEEATEFFSHIGVPFKKAVAK
jgi:large subunit ribosomal protein L5